MYIKGIGKVKKEDVMSILTTDGKEVVNNGDISIEELEEMYKLEQVKTLSQIGSMLDTFQESYKWIPDELKVELRPDQLAELTDQFYHCYSAGKSIK